MQPCPAALLGLNALGVSGAASGSPGQAALLQHLPTAGRMWPGNQLPDRCPPALPWLSQARDHTLLGVTVELPGLMGIFMSRKSSTMLGGPRRGGRSSTPKQALAGAHQSEAVGAHGRSTQRHVQPQGLQVGGILAVRCSAQTWWQQPEFLQRTEPSKLPSGHWTGCWPLALCPLGVRAPTPCAPPYPVSTTCSPSSGEGVPIKVGVRQTGATLLTAPRITCSCMGR